MHWQVTLKRLLHFAGHVLRRFHEHRGLLLSGAVAYNILLSVVPLGGLLLVVLSNFVERDALLEVFAIELGHVLPGPTAERLTREISALWGLRDAIGTVSVLMLLFFGSVAFRVLGDAMTAVFAEVRRGAPRVRGFVASFAVPFLFVGLIGVGLIAITLTSSLVERFSHRSITLLGYEISMSDVEAWPVVVGGVAGEVLLFTLAYLVLPGIRVRPRDAVLAAVIATVQWEIVRRAVTWYFTSVSTIGVVYGSLATLVIALMTAELAAIILLLGSQVLAELTLARQRGVAWYELSPASPRAIPRTNR